jgi:hypothetical protein
MLDEHFRSKGNSEGGILGYVEALGVGVDDLLDTGD